MYLFIQLLIWSLTIFLYSNSSAGHMSPCVVELLLLKNFGVVGDPRLVSTITQVHWYRPLCDMVKCNSDGAAKGCLRHNACGEIFRYNWASILGVFQHILALIMLFRLNWLVLCGPLSLPSTKVGYIFG